MKERDFQMSPGDCGTGLAKYKNGSKNRNLWLHWKKEINFGLEKL